MANKYWVGGGGAWSQPVFTNDSFTGTDGTDLSAHTATSGATWVLHPTTNTGSIDITNANRIRGNASVDSLYYASTVLNNADYTVQADLFCVTDASTTFHIVGRMDTVNKTFYMVRYLSGSGIQLFKCINGTYTALTSTYSYSMTPGQTSTLQLFLSGQTVGAVLNGAFVLIVPDGSITAAGKSGVMYSAVQSDTVGVHADNFKTLNANWSTTSGGAPNTTAPGSGDAVIIDSNSSNSNNMFTILMDTTTTIASFAASSQGSFGSHEDDKKWVTLSWPGNNPVSVGGNITIDGDIQLQGISGQGGFIMTATATYTSYTASYLPYLGINVPSGTVTLAAGQNGGAGTWYNTNNYFNYLDLLAGTLNIPEFDTGGHALITAPVYCDTLSCSNSTATRVLSFYSSGSQLNVSTLLDCSITTGLTVSNASASQFFINNQSRLATDSLVGIAGTNLNNHIADDGSTWTGQLDSWTGNLLFDSNNHVYFADTSVASYRNNTLINVDDYSVQADMYMPLAISGEGGIWGRFANNADTGYVFRYDGVSGQWELLNAIAGTYATLATNNNVGVLPSNGGTYTMKMTMIGNQITCYVNGVQIMQVIDNSISGAFGSYAGFRMNTLNSTNTTGFHFSNFQVNRLSTYPVPTFKGGGYSWGSLTNQYGNTTITGNNTIASLQSNQGITCTLTGSNTITSWNITAGTSWVLGSNQTQTTSFGNATNGTNQQNVSLSATTLGVQAKITLTSSFTTSWWNVADVKVNSPYQIQIYRGVNLGDNTNVIFVVGQNKAYAYDIYDYIGNYVGQIVDSIQDPEISQEINTPGGQITIRRGVDPINFGEGTLVAFNNKIIMRVFDDDYPNGVVYFQGFIADYTPNMEPDNQYVDIIALPYGATLNSIQMITDPTVDVATGGDPSSYPAHQQSDSATYIAQQWTAGAGVTNLTSLYQLWLEVGTGFGDQTMYYEICPDNSGTPDRTKVLYSGTLGSLFTNFPAAIQTTPGALYYFVVHANPGLLVNSYACVAGGAGNVLQCSSTGANGSWTNESHGYSIANFATYTSTGNTQVAFSSANLRTIIQDTMNNYNIQGGVVTYTDESVPVALESVVGITYTFQTNTVLAGLNKCLDFCPAGWYWYVDQATNVLWFKPMATTPTHYLTLGKDIVKCQLQKTMETVVNDLLVSGGDDGSGFNLYRRYYNLASINRYGRRQDTYNDTQLVNAATADIIGESSINATKNPTQRSTMDVFSYPTGLNNTGGYNIESMHPGDVLFIQGLPNAVNLQISRIDYLGYYATIDVTDIPPQLNVQAQNIADGLAAVQTQNNPTAPTIVVVP